MSLAVYQTNWFWVAGIAAGLGGLCLLHQVRVRQVRARIEGRQADLHYALLQDVLGLTLKIHAAVKQMPSEEPVRQILERILEQFDQVLTESTDRLQKPPHQPLAIPAVAGESQAYAGSRSDRALAWWVPTDVNCVSDVADSQAVARFSQSRPLFAHSEALHAEVEIAYHPEQFRLRVRDGGRGIACEVLQ